MVARYLHICLLFYFTALPRMTLGEELPVLAGAREGYRLLEELPGVTWQSSSVGTPEKLDNLNWRSLDQLVALDRRNYGWLHLKLKNDLSRRVYFDFRVPHADSIVLFAKTGRSISRIVTGPYVSARNWHHPENPAVLSLHADAATEYEVYIRLWSSTGRPFSFAESRIQTREQTNDDTLAGYRESVNRTEFNGFFLGAIGFALLLSIVIFLRIGEKMFLYYSLYLFGIAVYALVVKTLPFSALAKAAYLDYPLTYKLGEPVQYLSFAAYISFGRHLLDTYKYFILNIVLTFVTRMLAICGVCLLVYNLIDFNFGLQEKIFVLSRIVILPLSIALVVWISIVVRSPIKWFFVIGSSFFLLGGLLAVVVDPKTRHLFWDITPVSSVYLFKTGILVETFFFALALGYKLRLNQKEKELVTLSYIDQLDLNRQLVATENLRLEDMVRQRTNEMIKKNAELELENRKRVKSDFDKQLAELEMKALRSQINPHFIFNSLNSIRYQILKSDYQKASDYLVRFAKLLRKILQSSREQVISLQEELEMVALYLDMERLRFSDNFSYDIIVNPAIDLDEIQIPPMLIQPYVENSVKHGLISSKKPVKKLSIEVSLEQDGYRIEIIDNGVGRVNTSAKASENLSGLGMKITNERITLFNRQYSSRITAGVTDLYEGNIPSGTLITLYYKC